MQDAVGPPGTATKTIVIEFDQVGKRRERNADGTVCALYVAQMTWILHGNDASRSARSVERLESWCDPLVDIAHTRAEAGTLFGAQQVAVVFEHRAAARGIDDDQRVARQRLDRGAGRALGFVLEPCVHGESATTRGGAT